MTDAVVVQDVVKRFGATTALAGVSCTIRSGELFGFIGPDGAGKTTLFRILATLLVPDKGQRASARRRRRQRVCGRFATRIGYMAGRFSLYPDLSVEENLRFFASVFGTTIAAERERIAPIYGQLEPFKERRAGALSGGMKQKLALCCALVHRPEILFLDEPTTGVDAVSRREFWDLLGDLKAGGLTAVVSTPYMDEADRCDRIALIQRGRLLAIDTPGAVARSFDRPLARGARRTGVTRRCTRCANTRIPTPRIRSARRFTSRTSAWTCPPQRSRAELRAFLESRGFGNLTVEPTAPTVEDTFMARMGGEPSAEHAA